MNIRNANLPLVVFAAAACVCLFSGCATGPTKPAGHAALPVYNLNGASYVPLVPLCDTYGINWEYDTFTRTVVLTKDLHRFNLTIGEKMILADGRPENLTHPVEMYQGTVVVPIKLQERLVTLFAKAMPQPAPLQEVCLLRIRKVVIDAGHGGNDPGAIGKTGVQEKNVNLDIAKRLGKLLSDAGFQVVFTRSRDNFIPLEQRVGIANSSGADLFLSIHSNANRVKGLNGFEVYYVSPALNDCRRALLAAKESRPALNTGTVAGDNLNLRATLWNLIYTACRAESMELARSLCRSIDRDLDTRVLGVKGANYYVLKGARMPAVLIEIGFLSNTREEKLLKNDFYRQQIAEAIADGIQSYARDYTIMEASR